MPTHTPGSLLGIRLDTDAAAQSAVFYMTSDDTTWTQLGTTVTGAAAALFDGSAVLEVAGFAGHLKRVKISTIDGSTTWGNEDVTDKAPAGWSLSQGGALLGGRAAWRSARGWMAHRVVFYR